MFCCLHFTHMYSSILYFLLPINSSIGSQKIRVFFYTFVQRETLSLTAVCFDLGCRQVIEKIPIRLLEKTSISCIFATVQLHGICFKSAMKAPVFRTVSGKCDLSQLTCYFLFQNSKVAKFLKEHVHVNANLPQVC